MKPIRPQWGPIARWYFIACPMDCIHQAFNFSCPSGLAKMQYPSGILLVCPLAISPIILALICRFSPDGVICPMGRMAPDGPMGPMERWCPMAPDGPMGPMKTISRWARWARWIHLPDGPDGDNCPMGPIARWPPSIRQAMWRHDLHNLH